MNLQFIDNLTREYLLDRYHNPQLECIPRFQIMVIVKSDCELPVLDNRFSMQRFDSHIFIRSEKYQTPSYSVLYQDFEYLEKQWRDCIISISGLQPHAVLQLQ